MSAKRKPLTRAFWRRYGLRLRIVRAVLDLSEQQAADDHGVTLRTYRKWEAGFSSNGSSIPLVRFCKKRDVNADWLLAGEVAGLGKHLIRTKTKVAILPALTAREINLQKERAVMMAKIIGPPDATG